MKKTGIYIGIMALAVVVFSSAYYFSYKKTLEKYKEETGKEPEIKQEETAEIEPQEPMVAADTVKEEKISKNTVYKLITYNLKDSAYKEEEVSLPVEWIGYSRQDLLQYLADYMENKSLTEVRKGLISFDLQSFSGEQVVLIKNYDPESMPYEYYVASENYEVVVYYCDKKTVFEYTGIDARKLSYEDQQQLLDGIFVLDKEELYGILENYSS